jgi:hypothetical protein
MDGSEKAAAAAELQQQRPYSCAPTREAGSQGDPENWLEEATATQEGYYQQD